jgi:hypothetical protein
MSDLPPMEISVIPESVEEVSLAVLKVVNTDKFLISTNNLSELESAGESRDNLGLGTAALADANDFATAAQGQLAESALQPESIGEAVQPHDPAYNTFTDNEKTKLAGIQDGAQVNPDLSAYAPIASPIITGFPQLPNNTRINNIEHFYQSTKPVTRGDGSALVIGDRWWKPMEGTEWFWNGTYWLSTTRYHISSFSAAILSASNSIIANWANLSSNVNGSFIIQTPFKAQGYGESSPIFFDSLSWRGNIATGATDTDNYWSLVWILGTRRNSLVESNVAILTTPFDAWVSSDIFECETSNIAFSFIDNSAQSASGGADYIKGYCFKVGSPPALSNQTLYATFRDIHS